MNYVIYENTTGIVRKILSDQPELVDEGFSLVKSDALQPYDEFNRYIVVHHVDESGQIESYSAIKQGESASEMLKIINEKDIQIKELQELVADLIELQLSVGNA